MTKETTAKNKKAAPKKGKTTKKAASESKQQSEAQKAVGLLEEKEAELEAREAEMEEMKKELLYQRAELENFKRRTRERFDDSVRYAAEKVVNDLLPVLDNLERALEHSTEAEAETAEALAEGVGHTVTQFKEALAAHGVEVIEAMGETFDPNIHEALAQMPGDADNVVMAVHEKGYKLNGKLLRPARVVVSRLATPKKDG